MEGNFLYSLSPQQAADFLACQTARKIRSNRTKAATVPHQLVADPSAEVTH
jgi:hypothetical protein